MTRRWLDAHWPQRPTVGHILWTNGPAYGEPSEDGFVKCQTLRVGRIVDVMEDPYRHQWRVQVQYDLDEWVPVEVRP